MYPLPEVVPRCWNGAASLLSDAINPESSDAQSAGGLGLIVPCLPDNGLDCLQQSGILFNLRHMYRLYR